MPGPSVFALLLLLTLARADTDSLGLRHEPDLVQAAKEVAEVKNELETGKLYFTGTGYTVNLIPHAVILGLLTFAVIFLYGDSLFGTDISGYGAPATGYGG